MTDQDVRRLEDKVDGVALALARLEGSLSPTLEKLTDKQDDHEHSLEDHEKRLRSLEKFRWSVPSLSLLGFLVSVALFVFYITH